MKKALGIVLLFFFCMGCNGVPSVQQDPPQGAPPPIASPAPDPPPPPPQELSFFAFGDWGTGGANQAAVATALKNYCNANPCDFGVLLGDNFYPSGVSSTADSKWQDYFEDVYSGLNMIFYASLGNHDFAGNIQAQIDYTGLQNRWYLPARKYQVIPPAAQGDPPLLELFIVDSNNFTVAGANQLLTDMTNSSALWKIVAMHHPIYSNGLHGDTASLQGTLLPVVCQNAQLVLSGHDHLFSHLDDANDGCSFHQVVAGGGGKSLYATVPDARALFSESAYGFGVFKVSPTEIVINFYRSDGSLGYSYTLTK